MSGTPKFQPLWDNVIIDVDEVKQLSDSGLYIAATAKEIPPYGTIISAGPGCRILKKGDRVVFARYAARYLSEDVTEENTGLRLVKESDCWAIIKG